MKALIYLDRSMACAESHELEPTADSTVLTVPLDDGPWIGFLYGSMRTQDGDDLGLELRTCGCWWHGGQPYSDLTIHISE